MIQSLTGSTIRDFEIDQVTERIDLSELQNGIYFVTFVNSGQGQSVTKKLIIQ